MTVAELWEEYRQEQANWREESQRIRELQAAHDERVMDILKSIIELREKD